jgi:hypothetical protein
MKLSDLKEASNRPDPKILQMENKSFRLNGIFYYIWKIEHNKSFGSNYSFYLSGQDAEFNDKPVDPGHHPYGDRKFIDAFNTIVPKGLEAYWSEAGMQGDGFVNFDIGKAKPKVVLDVKNDLKKFKDHVVSLGYTITKEEPTKVFFEKKRKGKFYIGVDDSEDRWEDQYTFQKIGNFGWGAIENASFERLFKSITSGFSKSYL